MQLPQNISNEAVARAGLYELYARLLLNEVDLEMLSLFHRPEWGSCFHELGINIPPGNAMSVETLAVDYCNIFIGPKDFCPPYQSVWEDGHLQSEVVASMNDYLEVVSPVTTQNIKDHAGLQLEMMSQILRYESQPDTEPSTLSVAFFHDHIGWTERMFSLGIELAKTEFYGDFLSSAEVFIASEKSRFRLDLAD
tara:strand:+ start:95 stop:679 length:585 start_codon:yes stop_codon:yes gene_type:complete